MNLYTFTGNLGRSADTKFVGDKSVTEFSVAVKSGYGDKAVTTWVNCKAWGDRYEKLAQYLNKGTLVAVSGELTLREYDKKDGSGKGHSLEVRVNDVTLCGKSEGATQASTSAAVSGGAGGGGGVMDDLGDDIPF